MGEELRHRLVLIQFVLLEVILREGSNPLHLLAKLRCKHACESGEASYFHKMLHP